MKLEAGKKYVDRRGRVYGPIYKTAAFFGESDGQCFWMWSGALTGSGECDMDLIDEYVEPSESESPDDWVTQAVCPPRIGIDEVRWSHWDADRWVSAAGPWEDRHGFTDGDDGSVLSVRCRRRDLPKTDHGKPVETVRAAEHTVSLTEAADNLTALGDALRNENTKCSEIGHIAGKLGLKVHFHFVSKRGTDV